ncbi:MAG: Uncharacterised protein [Synechococcus sp. CC9902]|nr:MAG: Uncharacterised protein [Synechococcus sp. CC9902]
MTSVHQLSQISKGFIPWRSQFDQVITIGVGQAVARSDPAANNPLSGNPTVLIQLNSHTQRRSPLASAQTQRPSRQVQGEHRYDAISQVQACGASSGFKIQR